MLKKWKALLLAGVLTLSLGAGVACGGADSISSSTGDSSSVESTLTPTLTEDGKTLMNGFEVFDRDIQLIRLIDNFGRVDDNTDRVFVRTGEHSLKINALGNRLHSANPYFLLPTTSIRFPEVSFGDFSKVDTLSMWFYNNEEENVNVGVGFGTGVLSLSSSDRRDHIKKTCVEYYTLSHGWNYVEYGVDPAYLSLQGLDIAEVYGVVVEFDYVQSHKLADSPEVYLDDVCLTYVEEPKSMTLDITVKSGTTVDGNPYWSIADFENPKETYYMYYGYSHIATPHSAFPILKTVFAGDYNTIAKSGTQALLVGKKSGGTDYGWPSLCLHADVMKAVFDAIGDDIYQNPDKYAFKVDIYNASKYDGGFTIEFQGAKTWDSPSIKAGQWYTYSTTIGRINGKKTGEKAYTEQIGYVNFLWSRYNTDADRADRPFLFDNIRIEKIAE